MLARDEPPQSASLNTQNAYGISNVFEHLLGVLPFYIGLEADGCAHGVLILNSNAQEIITTPAPALAYRTIGGILDIYFFPGPKPEDVVKQYLAFIGTPFLPPYWALGFQVLSFKENF